MLCTKCQIEFDNKRRYTLYGSATQCSPCVANEGVRRLSVECPKEFWDNQFERSGIPLRYRNLENGVFSDRARNISNRALLEHKPLFLEGAVETGKTLTLATLAVRLERYGVRTIFVHCGWLASKLRGEVHLTSIWNNQLSTVRHLFLDDLGSEADRSGWWSSWIGAIVDHRLTNLLPTSASANNSENIDPRIVRRLAENSLFMDLKPI